MSFRLLRGWIGAALLNRFTATAAQVDGDPVVSNGRFGVVHDETGRGVESGAEGLFIVGTDEKGIQVRKSTGAIGRNARVFWDPDANPVTGSAGSGAATASTTAGANEPVLITATGGAAGNITATGIAVGDTLVEVIAEDTTSGVMTNLTSEFTISGANQINNTGGTATTGKTLFIRFIDASAQADRLYIGRAVEAAGSGDEYVTVHLSNQ